MWRIYSNPDLHGEYPLKGRLDSHGTTKRPLLWRWPRPPRIHNTKCWIRPLHWHSAPQPLDLTSIEGKARSSGSPQPTLNPSSYCYMTKRWKIDYLRFYVPLKNFSLTWRRHHCRWRAAKFRPMLGTQGLWAGRDLYRATGPQFMRSHPKDRPIQSPLTTHEGVWRIYSNPDPHGDHKYDFDHPRSG
jgi:hypothetical protein